jgi:hypothetical protein
MKKRSLASPFVVTFSMLACSRDAPQPAAAATVDVPPPPPTNPPATATATATPSATATSTATKPERVDYSDYPRTLNATTTDGTPIFRGYGDKVACYIEVPWPKGKPRLPGQVNTKDVPCPPPMQTDAWKVCPGGVVNAKKDDAGDATRCACFQTGNPPPIPHEVPCP